MPFKMEKLIFFVDDDKMMLNLLEYTMKNRQNYDIRTFNSGEDCLKNMELKPNLIVLDHIFNGTSKMSGIEVLKEIKKVNKLLPVVILSSTEDQSIAKEFLMNGASRFILKNDYFIDTLMEAIDHEIH